MGRTPVSDRFSTWPRRSPRARTPVLILGDRGTGKALLAKTIHGLGSRADQAFVTVDCAALAQAEGERSGNGMTNGGPVFPSIGFDWSTKLAQAQGGTLFLNDVSALTDNLQHQVLQRFKTANRPRAKESVPKLMSGF